MVTTAGSAEEALRVIDGHGPFDVYVLDVMMPEVRGTARGHHQSRHPAALVLSFTATRTRCSPVRASCGMGKRSFRSP